jgi:hypothetical protein
MALREGLGPPPPQQAFVRWNDPHGTELIGLNRDGTIYCFGINFADGTTQDTATPAGSSVSINGSPVSSPNFTDSASVTFSITGSNISLTASGGGAFLPLAGGTMTGPITGNVFFIDPNYGASTGLKLTDESGNLLALGNAGGVTFCNVSVGTTALLNLDDQNGGELFIQAGSQTLTMTQGKTRFTGTTQYFGPYIAYVTDPPTSVATAGLQGQLQGGTDGNLYFCTVTGTVGNAVWNKVNLTAV